MNIKIVDTQIGKTGYILHAYRPQYEAAISAIYAPLPTTADCYFLVRYDDLTFGIQSLNNLLPL